MTLSRRHLTGCALAMLVAPGAARSQQRPAAVARVGVLEGGAPSAFPDRVEALRQGLAELGYVDGQTVVLDYRWAHGQLADLPRLAGELVRAKVDVIVAGTTVAALAAKEAGGEVPIVFAVPADPVGVGLVASLPRPGGRITGLTTGNVEIAPKRLELLKEITAGRISRAGLLFNQADASNVIAARAMHDAARQLALSLRSFTVDSADDFEAAFNAMAAERIDALVVAAGALTDSHAGRLAALAARIRVPAIYGARGFVQAGGLVSYSASFTDNYRRAAAYVHRILHGAAPGDLPVEQANRFELAINLRTARELKLSIAPAFRLRADFVIE